MSLKPGTRVANPYPETPAEKGLVRQLSSLRFQMGPAVGAVTRTDLDFMEEVEHCMFGNHVKIKPWNLKQWVI